MSIKIYNAYIIEGINSIEDLYNCLFKCKDNILKISQQKINEYIFKESLFLYDYFLFFGKEKFIEQCKCAHDIEKIDFEKNIIDILIIGMKNRVEKIKNTNYRDPEIDFTCQLSIFKPLPNKKIVVKFFTEKQEYLKVFQKMTNAKDFHYQNQTEHPDDLVEEQWNERRKIWDDIFEGNKRYCDVSLSFDIIDYEELVMQIYKCREYKFDFKIFSYKQRVKRILASNLLIVAGLRLKEKQEMSNRKLGVSDWMQINDDLLKESSLKEQYEKEIAKVLDKKIDKDKILSPVKEW